MANILVVHVDILYTLKLMGKSTQFPTGKDSRVSANVKLPVLIRKKHLQLFGNRSNQT